MRVGKCGCIRLFRGAVEELQCLLPREMVQITLHTPPSFTGCFPDRCCLSQPCCVQNRGFLPIARPPIPPFARQNAIFSLEILPLFARYSPDKVQAQREFRLETRHPGTRFPTWRAGSESVVCGCTCFCRCILQASPLDRLSADKSRPAMSRRRAVALALHGSQP